MVLVPILFVFHTAIAQVPVEVANDQQALLKSGDPVLAANKKLVYDYWREVLQGHDLSKAEQYMTEDFIEHNPTVPTGRQGFVDTFKKTFKAAPLKLTIDNLVTIVAERNLVVLVFREEKVDPKNPAKKYTTTWFDMFGVKDGKIHEHWDFGTL